MNFITLNIIKIVRPVYVKKAKNKVLKVGGLIKIQKRKINFDFLWESFDYNTRE